MAQAFANILSAKFAPLVKSQKKLCHTVIHGKPESDWPLHPQCQVVPGIM